MIFHSAEEFLTDTKPCKTHIYVFSKNIQPLRHGKMDGHIKIQMQKRRILLFLRHAALANTVVSEKHKPDTNERCFYCLAS